MNREEMKIETAEWFRKELKGCGCLVKTETVPRSGREGPGTGVVHILKIRSSSATFYFRDGQMLITWQERLKTGRYSSVYCGEGSKLSTPPIPTEHRYLYAIDFHPTHLPGWKRATRDFIKNAKVCDQEKTSTLEVEGDAEEIHKKIMKIINGRNFHMARVRFEMDNTPEVLAAIEMVVLPTGYEKKVKRTKKNPKVLELSIGRIQPKFRTDLKEVRDKRITILKMLPQIVSDKDLKNPKSQMYVRSKCRIINDLHNVAQATFHIDLDNKTYYWEGKKVEVSNGDIFIEYVRDAIRDMA